MSWNADRSSRLVEVAVDVFRTRGELACPKRITIVNGIPGGIPDGIPQFRVLPSAGKYNAVRTCTSHAG